MARLFVREVTVVKRAIWVIIPLLLVGASTCSGSPSNSTSFETLSSGLDGVEFVVHQAPG